MINISNPQFDFGIKLNFCNAAALFDVRIVCNIQDSPDFCVLSQIIFLSLKISFIVSAQNSLVPMKKMKQSLPRVEHKVLFLSSTIDVGIQCILIIRVDSISLKSNRWKYLKN